MGESIEVGDGADLDANALFEQQFINEIELRKRIERSLQTRTRMPLQELLQENPIEQGLQELIAYVKIASERDHTLIDTNQEEEVAVGEDRVVTLPRIVFQR
jgi:hypothetical protein